MFYIPLQNSMTTPHPSPSPFHSLPLHPSHKERDQKSKPLQSLLYQQLLPRRTKRPSFQSLLPPRLRPRKPLLQQHYVSAAILFGCDARCDAIKDPLYRFFLQEVNRGAELLQLARQDLKGVIEIYQQVKFKLLFYFAD